MVVVLMDFLVDSCLDVLVLVGLDSLMCDTGSYRLVDSGVVVTGLRDEVGYCCFSFLHCDDM